MNSIIPQHAKTALEEDAKVRAEVRRRFEREKSQKVFGRGSYPGGSSNVKSGKK
jgi:hypothetical protein